MQVQLANTETHVRCSLSLWLLIIIKKMLSCLAASCKGHHLSFWYSFKSIAFAVTSGREVAFLSMTLVSVTLNRTFYNRLLVSVHSFILCYCFPLYRHWACHYLLTIIQVLTINYNIFLLKINHPGWTCKVLFLSWYFKNSSVNLLKLFFFFDLYFVSCLFWLFKMLFVNCALSIIPSSLVVCCLHATTIFSTFSLCSQRQVCHHIISTLSQYLGILWWYFHPHKGHPFDTATGHLQQLQLWFHSMQQLQSLGMLVIAFQWQIVHQLGP